MEALSLSTKRLAKSVLKKTLVPSIVVLGLLLGFGREMVLAFAFGTGRAIEVFRVGYAVPSIITEAVAVSVVSALIAMILKNEAGAGFRLAWNSTLVLAGAVTVIGVLTMPLQARLLAPGFDSSSADQLVAVGAACWLIVPFTLATLSLRAWLSLEGRQWATSAGTALRSGFFILAILLIYTVSDARSAFQPVFASVAAAVLSFVVYYLLFRAANRPEVSLLSSLSGRDIGKAASASLALWGILLSQVLLSSNRIIDRILASDMPAGTLAAVEYSYSLVMAAAAVFATSINILIAPQIGRTLKDVGIIAGKTWVLIGGSVAASGVCGFLSWRVAEPITRAVYERGQFDSESTALTAEILSGQSLFLAPLVLSLILVQIVIILGGVRWLIAIAVFKLAVKLIAVAVIQQTAGGVDVIILSFGAAECGSAGLLLVVAGFLLSRRRRENSVESVPNGE